jgi:hypothetical protein
MKARMPLVAVAAALWLAAHSVIVPADEAVPAGKDAPAAKGAQEPIDFDKARQLLQRSRNGQKLTAEEQAYLDRARAVRRQMGQAAATRPAAGAPQPAASMTPLTDLASGQTYKGQSGGLYGEGRNEPPAEHAKAALAEAAKIRPLDAAGQPAADGKIVLISSGMSNVTQEFQQFLRLAAADAEKSTKLVIVDGAQGGQEASDWADPENRFRGGRANPWDELDRRIKQAGVAPQQVQVAWLKQARRNPASLGEFPKHAEQMKADLTKVLNEMKRRFPNLRIVYLSSRIYAGYARSPLNPEPYAYETAFTMRWLIEDQIRGEPALNYDAAKGEVKAPLLVWGPYLWADGANGRKTDDLVWRSEDFASDGTHPGDSGRRKVAELLLKFFKTDPTAATWYK